MTQHAYTGHAGPYIVKVINPKGATEQDADGRSFYVPTSSRRAVATLEEARDEVFDLLTATDDLAEHLGGGAGRLAESIEPGERLGPLPDGTLIEVEPRQWYQLAEDVGWDFHRDAHRDEAELLAAYNAAQAKGLMT